MILRWKPGSIQRETRYVDVRNMFENQDFTNDEYLRPRDIVYVPRLAGDESQEVLVLGSVGSVGYHSHYKGMTVLKLVASVGGVGENPGASSARILRPNEDGEHDVIAVDIHALFNGLDFSQNHHLKPGDIFYVPPPNFAASGSVFFLGEVSSQGPFPLPFNEELTLARAMMQVVPSQFARLSKVKVRRYIDGVKQEIEFNVKKILDSGEFENDLPLQDGDMVIVEEAVLIPDF